jgi:4-diphosphocytidyl-2-C-methyl-D-erythritol kinase
MLKNDLPLPAMILFSHAKVNLGLHITGRRSDGFHELESVMLPVGLQDIIEIRVKEGHQQGMLFSQSGIPVGSPGEENLCQKAYRLLNEEVALPPVELHLHKQIPVGAGLGGGSSNASLTLKGLNALCENKLAAEALHRIASQLGSDCPFFLYDRAMMMEGRGEVLSKFSPPLEDLEMVILFPGIHISTAKAYAGVTPRKPERHLSHEIDAPREAWKKQVRNDFEEGIYREHPVLKDIRDGLYRAGALYASMSGSGSSLYAISKRPLALPEPLSRYEIWRGPANFRPGLS